MAWQCGEWSVVVRRGESVMESQGVERRVLVWMARFGSLGQASLVRVWYGAVLRVSVRHGRSVVDRQV